jgi:hypothetical protein
VLNSEGLFKNDEFHQAAEKSRDILIKNKFFLRRGVITGQNSPQFIAVYNRN